MADNRRSVDRKAINQAKRNYQLTVRGDQIQCNHCDPKGPIVDSLSNTKEFIKNKQFYNEFAVVCTDCKDVFEMNTVTQSDAQNSLKPLYNMCNQAKMLFNPSDEDYDKIMAIEEFLDELQGTFIPYYMSSVKQLTNGKQKQQQRQRQKGKLGLGISSSQFSTGR